MPMTISEVSRLTGCSAPTIRFYESIALIPSAVRTEGGRRSYGWPDVKRLQFIRRARDFGMSVEQVRELLATPTESEGACGRAREVVRHRLEDVRLRRRELALLEASLDAMARRCDEGCGLSEAAACTILDDIARVESPAAT